MKTAQFLKQHTEVLPIMGPHEFTETKIISVFDLYANQEEINGDHLKKKLKGKNDSVCYVAIFNGKYILLDGHHTVIAKMLNGKSKIKALCNRVNKT
jgi:hypothetical protein